MAALLWLAVTWKRGQPHAGVTQLEEYRPFKPGRVGSSPIPRTKAQRLKLPIYIVHEMEVNGLSEKAGALLKNARKAAGMTRPQVYQVTAISESVLDRWERGETVPDLESLDKLELLYRIPGLWQECLMLYYPSFRRHFPQMVTLDMLPALINNRHQLQDVLALNDAMERDALDGRIDNENVKARYIKECQEARAALTEAITRLEGSA